MKITFYKDFEYFRNYFNHLLLILVIFSDFSRLYLFFSFVAHFTRFLLIKQLKYDRKFAATITDNFSSIILTGPLVRCD